MQTYVFIVRPFGEKSGVDFDRVEDQIIKPVLDERPDTEWGTTGPIVESGNIRADMMERLLTADLVIADISIHNANVYYELGVRHALRHRPTILINSRVDAVPFDLKTDRYLRYDPNDPETSRNELSRTIEATLKSDNTDSPVYQLIPSLERRDGVAYLSTPREFIEAVERARKNKRVGQLGLLGDEARVERWNLAGQRLVGQALSKLQAHTGAGATWERVRTARPDDVEANLALATIYHRAGDMARSEEAIARVTNGEASRVDRAEALALRARNHKTQWTAEWIAVDDPIEQQRQALRSAQLLDCLTAYRAGFLEDINHYYPGVNALSMSTILLELAGRYPDVWEARFEDEDDAASHLRRQTSRREQLLSATALAHDAAKARARRSGETDLWLDLSIADHRFLTSDRVEHVAQGYRDATARTKADFNIASAAAQLLLFKRLDICSEKAAASLAALGVPDDDLVAGVPPIPVAAEPRKRIIVSTGHRIDDPGRAQPRFPAAAETAARAALAAAIEEERSYADGAVSGIAGLASGNDILFHEVAAELGLETEAVLALPEGQFLQRSVDGSGGTWPERFRRLCTELNPDVLDEPMPTWVSAADKHYVFQRCNMWMLEKAFAIENADVTLLALWNRAAGDGPGGTADMVELARSRGAKVVVLNTDEFLTAGD
ncbi:MAG: tetratricopeptide repeat-containing protein [Acidimicrobiales bacterium]